MEVQWQVHKNNEEMQAKLLPFLPQDVNYKIKTFQLFHDSDIPLERQFFAEFEVNICQKEKFYEHFHDFCMITSTSWNKRRGKDMDNPTAPRRIFRGERKCHHNVRKVVSKITGEMSKDEIPGKNTECAASIHFHINKHEHKEENCKAYPCVIRLNFNHNHVIEAASTLNMHAVTEETKQKLIDLFEAGYSASGAYHKHRQNIRTQYPNDWVRMLANRAISPNYPYAFRLNNQWLLKKFGRIDGPDSIMRAMQHAAAYNQQNPVDEPGKQSCFVHQREDGHYIIGIVNPLQRRVHEVNIFYV